MTAQTTTGVQTLDMAQICTELLNRHSDMSWREIASKPEYRGIPAGTLWSIAKGREPKSLRYRTILHLPALIPTPACPKCGAVHTTKRCTANKPAPRPSWRAELGIIIEKRLEEI
jgi:hypothetical protein